jgi:NAD(P)-dependent dehydrogenase (short-subunit alcohol dehydrogenase family)
MVSAIVPIKRVAETEEVADTVVFLCSPAASYINGTSVFIDAGVTTTVRLF